MASNCRAHPSSSVGSGSSRVPRITTRLDSTMRSMNARSTPARSTHIRMDFSQRYALIAGSQACGANLANCKRDSAEVRSCNAPCSQRNLMFLIGSIEMLNFHRGCSVFNAPNGVEGKLFRFPRAPQRAARFRTCVLAIFEHLHTIYENVLHAYRILMRFLIRGAVGNRRRIEYDHIGKHPLLEKPAMIEAQI